MRRASAGVVTVVLGVVFLAPPAGAAARQAAPHQRSTKGELADRDADRISDAFEPTLDSAAASDVLNVLVTFRPGKGSAAAAARSEVGSFSVDREYRSVRGFAAEMTADQIRRLARRHDVRRIEGNVRVRAMLDASRRDFGIDRARIDFPGVTGAGVGICIADTGLDAAHEQFDSKTIVFKDFVGSQTTPYDDQGHGTHVADIAAGDGTGGGAAALFRGVAPDSPLAIAKVLDSSGNGDDAVIIAGIDWCVGQPGVRVISLSLGTIEASDGQDALSQAVNNAVAAHGMIVVVAAGNSGDLPSSVGSPGAAANAITVAAVAEWSAPPNAGAGRHSDGVYLAPFSSRGPTLDGRMKPDIAAPGVTVTAAAAGTTATYVTLSGTSMATPFVAGTAALALQADPSLNGAGAKALLESTSIDRGPGGKDNDWGSGLLDGYAAVAEASSASSYTPTAFPLASHVAGSVANSGLWTYQFTLGPGDLAVPIAGTLTIVGTPKCVFPFGGGCLAYEWSPDLDARLKDPSGVVIADSTCAADDECGIGRQETVHAMPTIAGTYTIEVYPFAGSPNRGKGGSFGLDLSRGPVGVSVPAVPIHVGDLDGATSGRGNRTATVTITVHDGNHQPVVGVAVSGGWGGSATVSCTTDAAGRCSVSKNFSRTQTSLTFTVANLAKDGDVYLQSANHDPDGDSTGTSITVTRP